MKLTSVRCNNSLSLSVMNTTCSLKAFQRGVISLNMETFLIREINGENFNVHFEVFTKVRTSYHKLYEIKYDNLCQMLRTITEFNSLIIEVLDASATGIFVPCPWKVKLY